MKSIPGIWGIILILLFSSLIPMTSSYETNKIYTIHIDENGTLSGYVKDTSMNPIEGARVEVYFHETCEENYSDSSGYYNVTNIPICWCLKNATASKDGYTTEWVLLAIGENTTYDFVLTPLDTIYVDDDNTAGPWDGTQEHPYQHIRDGVINANNDDIIFVNSGFYHENVNIDKPITLIGADIWNTTIDGDKSNHAVFIKSNSVKISGFTIQEGYTGILVANSSDISINDNFIIDNIVGVAIRWNSNNNSVYNNEIRRNKNIGVLVDHVKQEKPNSFLMNNFIDNGKNAIAYGVKCQWSGNFWDDWIGLKFSFLNFLPYLVYFYPLNFYPLNFDMNPAKEPYDISMPEV